MKHNKMKVQLGPVQETLLIPLLGRAEDTKRKNGLIRDPKAVEIVEALDYNFSKWKRDPSLFGSCLRTKMFDEEVCAFLKEHPEGTVIEIGAGLNTRYERLDNGRAHFIELDLPDSMALRREFFEETERRKMIAASVLDEDWYAQVKAAPAPYCFISEAVIIYLDEAAVEGLLARLAVNFPGATLLTDTASTAMVEGQDKHSAMNKLPQDSWFRWRCDDPKSLERLGLRLERSWSFMDTPKAWYKHLTWMFWLPFTFAPGLMRKKAEQYHLNRFTLGA